MLPVLFQHSPGSILNTHFLLSQACMEYPLLAVTKGCKKNLFSLPTHNLENDHLALRLALDFPVKERSSLHWDQV